jgi:branched-chain amino acid aminotransferase
MPAEERRVSLDDLIAGFEQGTLTEAFGAGTAAVVAPIATINIHGKDYHLPPVTDASFQMRIKKKLYNIRHGIEPDKHNWNYTIVVK